MSSITSPRLRPAVLVVVAALLLLVGVGSTSYAAVNLAKNSVLSKHIKNGQVRAADLGADSVTSAKVKNGSLRAQDFAAGQLPAGPQGPQGEPGPVGTVTVVASSGPIAPGSFGGATALCPDGTEAVGGGPTLANVLTMAVTSSFPLVNGSDPFSQANGQYGPSTGWRAFARNDSGTTYSFKVAVVCAG